jgi:hypothetical protein
MSNICSMNDQPGMVQGHEDILYDLRTKPRKLDLDRMRKGFASRGYSNEKIELYIACLTTAEGKAQLITESTRPHVCDAKPIAKLRARAGVYSSQETTSTSSIPMMDAE